MSVPVKDLRDMPFAEIDSTSRAGRGVAERRHEAVRRAYHGTLKPVQIAGKLMMVTEFSDTLLIFLLKCRNPKVFRDDRVIPTEAHARSTLPTRRNSANTSLAS